VQLNVKNEATIVEIVSYVISKLKLKSGLKWNCQYLDRQESKWKTLVRNHSTAVLASSEFQGVGSDGGIQIRLVAPNTPVFSSTSSSSFSLPASSSSPKKSPLRLQKRPPQQHTSPPNHSSSSLQKVPATIPSDRSVVTRVTTSPVTGNNSNNNEDSNNNNNESSDGVAVMDTMNSITNNNEGKTKLKRFVMRSTPTRKVHKRNISETGYRNSGSLYSNNQSNRQRSNNSTWETPLFELEGWDPMKKKTNLGEVVTGITRLTIDPAPTNNPQTVHRDHKHAHLPHRFQSQSTS
jgi:hypothetical protein